MTDTIIGIDLGTTNSEAAMLRQGRIHVFSGPEGKLLPSFIGLDPEGNLLVGEAARNQYAAYPERTVRSVKRLMGQDTTIDLGGTAYTPQELSAVLLRALVERARQDLGQPPRRAVITVPAYFSDDQRLATRQAGEIAGLEVAKIINEPTAAALAYGAAAGEGGGGERLIMVYDLGGGTFDISVVRVQEGIIEVIASHGDNHLGGDDFDRLLADMILKKLRQDHGLEEEPDPRLAGRIDRAAEAAKRLLSSQPHARVREEYLGERDGQPVHLDMEISRTEYEAAITPLVDQTIAHAHQALRDAGITPSSLDAVILAGGSTRTPLVRERIRQEFRREPRAEVDPDLCVAAGAAMQAALLEGRGDGTVLVDVTPYTFGVSALGEVEGEPTPFMFVPLIRRNTPIPVSHTESFSTVYPGQEMVQVRVFQGEAALATENIEIGEFMVTGLDPNAQENSEILITFSLDANGILQVTAMEKSTGLARSITIDRVFAQDGSERLAASRTRVDALLGNGPDRDEPADPGGGRESGGEEDVPQGTGGGRAAALLERARRLLEAGELGDEDRQDLDACAAEVEAAIERGDVPKALMDELEDLLYFLED